MENSLILYHPNEIVKDILTVSGFNTIIDVSPTVKDALHDP